MRYAGYNVPDIAWHPHHLVRIWVARPNASRPAHVGPGCQLMPPEQDLVAFAGWRVHQAVVSID